MKSKTTALILSILLGELGVDRFYLGYVGLGILEADHSRRFRYLVAH